MPTLAEKPIEVKVRLGNDTSQVLLAKAREQGLDLATYLEEKLEREVRHDALAKLLEPLRAAYATSGMTEEELDELVETAREERYREMHGKPSEVL